MHAPLLRLFVNSPHTHITPHRVPPVRQAQRSQHGTHRGRNRYHPSAHTVTSIPTTASLCNTQEGRRQRSPCMNRTAPTLNVNSSVNRKLGTLGHLCRSNMLAALRVEGWFSHLRPRKDLCATTGPVCVPQLPVRVPTPPACMPDDCSKAEIPGCAVAMVQQRTRLLDEACWCKQLTGTPSTVGSLILAQVKGYSRFPCIALVWLQRDAVVGHVQAIRN